MLLIWNMLFYLVYRIFLYRNILTDKWHNLDLVKINKTKGLIYNKKLLNNIGTEKTLV